MKRKMWNYSYPVRLFRLLQVHQLVKSLAKFGGSIFYCAPSIGVSKLGPWHRQAYPRKEFDSLGGIFTAKRGKHRAQISRVSTRREEVVPVLRRTPKIGRQMTEGLLHTFSTAKKIPQLKAANSTVSS